MTCRCGALLTDGNAACIECFDPADIDCPECAQEYKHMLRDEGEQREFEAQRDARAEQ